MVNSLLSTENCLLKSKESKGNPNSLLTATTETKYRRSVSINHNQYPGFVKDLNLLQIDMIATTDKFCQPYCLQIFDSFILVCGQNINHYLIKANYNQILSNRSKLNPFHIKIDKSQITFAQYLIMHKRYRVSQHKSCISCTYFGIIIQVGI